MVQTIPENHPRWKILDPIFQTEDSRFRWRISHWTWWTKFLMAATTLNVLSQNISISYYYFIIAEFLYVLIYLAPNFPSCSIVKDPLSQNFTTVTTYFYVICYYYTYSQRWGSLDILIRISFSYMRDSIHKISNKIPWIIFPPKFSRYFHTLLTLNSKFEITTVPQIDL